MGNRREEVAAKQSAEVLRGEGNTITPKRLHLGCGENYLEGYVNIDYPQSKHTVQTKSVADEYHDIVKLRYPKESIEEIRLRHVFEHFSRPVACTLLTSWWSWLKPDGVLRIEVPDFDRSALVVLNPFSKKEEKLTALRHIFGSQEAGWAKHHEGWSPKRLGDLLQELGFELLEVKKNSYKGTFNFEIFAKKGKQSISKEDFERKVREFLRGYLIDDSVIEKRLLGVWMRSYRDQLKRTWAE